MTTNIVKFHGAYFNVSLQFFNTHSPEFCWKNLNHDYLNKDYLGICKTLRLII